MFLRTKLVTAIVALVFVIGSVQVARADGWAANPIAGGGLITAITATSVTITRKDVPTTVTVDANTVIKVDDVVKTLADLKVGLYAGAWGKDGLATEIRAFTPKAPTPPAPAGPASIAGGGLITDLTATSVTITRNGVATTVTIDANTIIKIDDVVKTAADLTKGLYAGAWGKDGLASEIRAFTPKSK